MHKFVIEFYEKEDGEIPVEEFLLSVNKKMRAKMLGIMGILQEKGNQLREPYSKYLQDGIFELRCNIEKTMWEGVEKLRKFDDFLQEQLRDEEFKKEYESFQPEFDVIKAMVEARTSQNLTQKELAERTGINQADICKLERGVRNPSLKLLKRLADGMDMMLKIEFVPKHKAR